MRRIWRNDRLDMVAELLPNKEVNHDQQVLEAMGSFPCEHGIRPSNREPGRTSRERSVSVQNEGDPADRTLREEFAPCFVENVCDGLVTAQDIMSVLQEAVQNLLESIRRRLKDGKA